MDKMQQLPLDLNVRTTSGHGDFLISACNEIAAQWIDRWPDLIGQARALNISGPEASGKSHLAAVWQMQSEARVLAASDLNDMSRFANEHFILDNLDPQWPEEALFHLFNRVAAEGGSLLLLSHEPVGQMPWKLKDLASRMRAVNLALIDGPDDQLLHALMQKNFAERQLVVPDRVVQYLVARMERSFAAARDIVGRMDEMSLARKSEITLRLAREAMSDGNQE